MLCLLEIRRMPIDKMLQQARRECGPQVLVLCVMQLLDECPDALRFALQILAKIDDGLPAWILAVFHGRTRKRRLRPFDGSVHTHAPNEKEISHAAENAASRR